MDSKKMGKHFLTIDYCYRPSLLMKELSPRKSTINSKDNKARNFLLKFINNEYSNLKKENFPMKINHKTLNEYAQEYDDECFIILKEAYNASDTVQRGQGSAKTIKHVKTMSFNENLNDSFNSSTSSTYFNLVRKSLARKKLEHFQDSLKSEIEKEQCELDSSFKSTKTDSTHSTEKSSSKEQKINEGIRYLRGLAQKMKLKERKNRKSIIEKNENTKRLGSFSPKKGLKIKL